MTDAEKLKKLETAIATQIGTLVLQIERQRVEIESLQAQVPADKKCDKPVKPVA